MTAAARPLALSIIIVLGALTAIGPLSLDAYLPAFPAIATELGVGATEVQISLTACLVGIALGQLVAGPVSDSIGRRFPLVIGAAGYAAASFACALAPDLVPFVLLRFVQGFMGAVGVVAARAVIRDVAEGPIAVRLYSQLSTAGGLAPVVAPLLGAAVLLVADWRGIFVALGTFGLALTVLLLILFRETLPLAHRRSGSPRAVVRGFTAVLRDRGFLGALAIGASAAVLLFAYISGSSFVLQESFGADAGQFALAFAINGLGLATLSQVNARLGPRWGALTMLRLGFAVQFIAALGLAAIALFAPREPALIPLLMVVFFGVVAPMGIVNPNYIARAMGRSRGNAGTASALIGATSFLTGGVVSPLTGLGDPVLSVAVLVVAGALGGLLLVLIVARRDRGEPPPQPETPGA
jgi:MFS transporter, DHA1 family, multidrug resistance protein